MHPTVLIGGDGKLPRLLLLQVRRQMTKTSRLAGLGPSDRVRSKGFASADSQLGSSHQAHVFQPRQQFGEVFPLAGISLAVSESKSWVVCVQMPERETYPFGCDLRGPYLALGQASSLNLKSPSHAISTPPRTELQPLPGRTVASPNVKSAPCKVRPPRCRHEPLPKGFPRASSVPNPKLSSDHTRKKPPSNGFQSLLVGRASCSVAAPSQSHTP